MKRLMIFLLCLYTVSTDAQTENKLYHEPYRPQLHFSPKAHWMNDPNGMVYSNGVYHLFFQHYPDGNKWGPMHWGHATSKDLIHWQELPIALYPDSLGYIFSGSAVADVNNTSGFGKNGKTPLVAIFTYHDPVKERAGHKDFETQGIAYSLDEGQTWTKYSANPVLKNPGIRDFRDPKVSWYAPEKKWIMTLATQDRITFYSSPDLKTWKRESDFGADKGAHGGVWECPDLFPLSYKGKDVWVLVANVNPGGPNGGAAAQYFTGNFDGHTFTPDDNTTKWIDYGPDNYAGVTWSNTGKEKIFIGWMCDPQYANDVPTSPWRSANTLPRILGIEKADGVFRVTSTPVTNLNKQIVSTVSKELNSPAKFSIQESADKNFSVTFSLGTSGTLVVGYDKDKKEYYIDRTGITDAAFNRNFAKKAVAPRLSNGKNINLTIIYDVASVEVFADNGLTAMTGIFFSKNPAPAYTINSSSAKVKVQSLKSIWP